MTILKELLEILKKFDTVYNNVGKGSNCIVYKHSNLFSNGIIAQDRLEVTVCNENHATALQKAEQIKRALVTTGANKKTEHTLEIALNGGGYYFNPDIKSHCFKAIFSISYKEGIDLNG